MYACIHTCAYVSWLLIKNCLQQLYKTILGIFCFFVIKQILNFLSVCTCMHACMHVHISHGEYTSWFLVKTFCKSCMSPFKTYFCFVPKNSSFFCFHWFFSFSFTDFSYTQCATILFFNLLRAANRSPVRP
jgi:hypothetical protein